ncbi:hypothetical protein FHR87_001665 [Azomonas macrocytogenes]|uniref:Uncharacterized protein n=1 Tax=Azomonas macrocytogenes TaxID=69962 RepID=A0A839T3K4_AZOMA|nr:hypothetical protein [Azomonas macrocytogenes]
MDSRNRQGAGKPGVIDQPGVTGARTLNIDKRNLDLRF